jgi:hypothetical protein
MIRVLLQYLLPLLLPMALYLLWTWFTRKRQAAGAPAYRLQDGPWFWLILAGVALASAGLVYVALNTGSKPGGTYIPPRWEDGRISPGRIE